MEEKELHFNEIEYNEEIIYYIISTYDQHYAKGIQTTEYIMSHSTTPDFIKGNVLKYVTRYGHKEGYNRKDLLKAIHYLYLMLYFHDNKFSNKKDV